jgi:hypothetical protein
MGNEGQERRRGVEIGKQEIMEVVQRAVNEAAAQAAAAATRAAEVAASAATELAIAHHQNQCPIASMQNEHNRMYKEIFNGEDGEHGISNELRNWITECRASARKWKQFWGGAAAIAGIIVIILAEPIQSGWQDFHSLMRLADLSPKIIKLTEDWERYYAAPPVIPPSVIQPQDSQPKTKPAPKKKPSYFSYPSSGGVSSLHQPPDIAHY